MGHVYKSNQQSNVLQRASTHATCNSAAAAACRRCLRRRRRLPPALSCCRRQQALPLQAGPDVSSDHAVLALLQQLDQALRVPLLLGALHFEERCRCKVWVGAWAVQ